MSKLWYEKSAKEWEEALPLGNGRLGAMIFGGVEREIIQVNEESMWFGGPVDRNNPDAREALPRVRELIFNGKIAQAERLLKYAFSGIPEGMHPYQTLGEIQFNFYGIAGATDYYRELSLDTAMYKQSFKTENNLFTRHIFISKPADAMIMYFKSENEGKISFDVILRREKFFDGVKKSGENGIYLYGNLGKGGVDFGMTLSAQAKDGKVSVIGEHLIVEEASEVMLYFTAATSYGLGEGSDIEAHNLSVIDNLKTQKYSLLVKEHMEDYQNLYNRVNFELGDLSDFDAIPTDERIRNADSRKGADIGLGKLYFDYGRYLLISCSRPGGLPATLQGLWNKDILPPWDSKYTVNINTEMNYWPAEVCNLSECHEPLFDLIKKVAENGRKTAEVMYGCRGFVCHHNTDIHGDTAPQDMWIPGSYWVMGGAWLCTHLWTHFEYTRDIEFLKEFFPIMRECATFFLDFMVEHNGYMVTCPSVSPENTFILNNGQMGSNIYGVTMDNQILRDLFNQCNEAASILGVNDELDNQIRQLKEKLIPTTVGIKGNILEWPADYEEYEPGHRHISHLYGLFPSDQISVDKTPDLAEAAKITLENRLSHGGGHTGWSRAWIMNHYAKLWDAEKTFDNLQKLFCDSTYPNLFDKHPPFQIDGNFGVTCAIAQMIVQCDGERIILLPALPKAWKKGSMSGLKVKGGGTVDISWKNGKVSEAKITFDEDITLRVMYGEVNEEKAFSKGETLYIKSGLFGKIKEQYLKEEINS